VALLAAAAELILARHPRLAGVVALPAAAGIVGLSVISRGQRSARLGFAAKLMDRGFDGCILAPLAWVARTNSHRIAVLALVGLSVSFLASYERARGEALDYRGSERDEYQAVRMSLPAVGLLAGWVEATLWAFLILSASAAGVRAWNVIRQHRKTTHPLSRR
jgi:phosphatidylglycerophosphate synthase